MPIDAAAPAAELTTHGRRIARLALGVAAAIAISQAIGWPLSYLAPLMTAVVLTMPVTRPPARLFIVIAVALSISVYSGYLLLPFLLHQRLAGILLLAIVLFHSFYYTARGGQAVVGLLVTVGLTLAVAVGTVSVDALQDVSAGVAAGAVAGSLIAGIAHGLLPDPVPSATAQRDSSAPQQAVDLHEAARLAWRGLFVVLPVVLWLILTSSSAANAAVMIKVASMGQESTQRGVRDAARSLLVSTLAGGFAAIVIWELLLIRPNLGLYTLLVAIAALVFGRRIFTRDGVAADASTWSYAILTLIVVLAPAALDTQTGSDASTRFYDRLLMFSLASFYGVAATAIFDVLSRRRQS